MRSAKEEPLTVIIRNRRRFRLTTVFWHMEFGEQIGCDIEPREAQVWC